MSKRIYVVVLNWNGKKFLNNCLSALQRSTYAISIVLVDNDSSDNSVQFVEKKFPNVHIIKNKHNFGWTGGNNIGIKYALSKKADAVLVLNNDTRIEKNAIKLLVSKLFSESRIGIVGPKIYFENKKNKISFAGGTFTKNRYFGIHRGSNEIDKGQYDGNENTDFITGAAIMIKKEVFEKIGFFDDRYYIYYDEADFCLRARDNYYKIKIVQDACVHHAFSGTVSSGSAFQHYYTTRNHFLFVETHAPLEVKIRELLRTPKTVFEFIKSRNDPKKKYSLLGIRDYYLRRFGERTYW